MRGIRFINGQEYMLCGRTSERDAAQREAKSLRSSWSKVRVIKISNWDYMIYVHGGMTEIEKAYRAMMKRGLELHEGRKLAKRADGCIDCAIYEPFVHRFNTAEEAFIYERKLAGV